MIDLSEVIDVKHDFFREIMNRNKSLAYDESTKLETNDPEDSTKFGEEADTKIVITEEYKDTASRRISLEEYKISNYFSSVPEDSF